MFCVKLDQGLTSLTPFFPWCLRNICSGDTLLYPFLSISVFNAKKQHIEPVQDLSQYVLHKDSDVWFSSTWHMQTPLENLEPGTFLLIEFCDQGNGTAGADASDDAGASRLRSLAWYRYDFNKEFIDTTSTKFDFRAPPRNMDSMFGTTPDGSMINVDIVISR
jgi:Cytoskeletal adhesion